MEGEPFGDEVSEMVQVKAEGDHAGGIPIDVVAPDERMTIGRDGGFFLMQDGRERTDVAERFGGTGEAIRDVFRRAFRAEVDAFDRIGGRDGGETEDGELRETDGDDGDDSEKKDE